MAHPPGYGQALEQALAELDTTTADAAAVRLARGYAAALDHDPDCLPRVGPLLLAVLAALGLTPAARNAIAKGGPNRDAGTSPLDELRTRRRQRAAAASDPAAS